MTDYAALESQLISLLDTPDWITNAAQASAFIKHEVADLNWVGFYVQRQQEILTLGPFQGLPACNPIPFSRGVCGMAARTRTTQRIDDVNAAADHIACDANSRSELVVPLIGAKGVWGVLDIDSPRPARFTEADQAGFERLARVFMEASDLAPDDLPYAEEDY